MADLDDYGIALYTSFISATLAGAGTVGPISTNTLGFTAGGVKLTVNGFFNSATPATLAASTINEMIFETTGLVPIFHLSGLNISFSSSLGNLADSVIFSGADMITGTSANDTLLGYAGND